MNAQPSNNPALHDDPLAPALAALSEPSRDSTELWRDALRASEARGGGPAMGASRLASMFASRRVRWIAAAAGLALVASPVLISMMTSPRPRFSVAGQPVEKKVATTFGAASDSEQFARARLDQAAGAPTSAAKPSPPPPPAPPPPSLEDGKPLDLSERQVIRKATLELTSKDVPAVFSKASLLVNESLGEFIERSSLSGAAPLSSAEIVLRVSASRLGTVLTQLRQLGAVVSENAGGDDVTDRVIDLDARLRNECRIETELLQLLESRPNASLEEVLKLRGELARVRLGIEQLEGQKQQLSRSVSLATILVIVRPDGSPAPAANPPASLGTYFRESVARSWSSGVKGLTDSLAACIENLLAGLIWWVVLITFAVFGVALARRAYRSIGVEPAPRLTGSRM